MFTFSELYVTDWPCVIIMTHSWPWRVDHMIMINVTWLHFDQSAKQLIVDRTTIYYGGTYFCVLWHSKHRGCETFPYIGKQRLSFNISRFLVRIVASSATHGLRISWRPVVCPPVCVSVCLLITTVSPAKERYLRSFNSIFGKIDRNASEEVLFELIKSKCLPILLYGTDVCPMNSADRHSLQFTINKIVYKIFGAMSNDIYWNKCTLWHWICRIFGC